MKPAEEERLLADLYIDLKGAKKKRTDWIEIAKKCSRLADHYGSVSLASKKLGVSYELVRSIISLLRLPKEVQALVKENKILYDAAKRLLTIEDAKKETEVARAIIGLPSHRQREIIRYARVYPESDLTDYIQRATRPRRRTETIHVAVVPLRNPLFLPLEAISKTRKISVEKLILNIVEEWLNKGVNR
jgi:hypothetical protein